MTRLEVAHHGDDGERRDHDSGEFDFLVVFNCTLRWDGWMDGWMDVCVCVCVNAREALIVSLCSSVCCYFDSLYLSLSLSASLCRLFDGRWIDACVRALMLLLGCSYVRWIEDAYMCACDYV